jgi:twinkle protein
MIIKPGSKAAEFRNLNAGGHAVKSLTTGFDDLDELIKIAKGYIMIGTGYPSSGKSEFTDAILINMVLLHNWNVLYFSPENFPLEEHMAKLSEKFIGTNIRSFSPQQIRMSLEFLDAHFTWMDEDDPWLDTILMRAQEQHIVSPIDCLVIDPWNNVLHKMGSMREDQYLSQALSKVLRFSRTNSIFTAVIAHPKNPQKQADGTYPVPDLYCISGGAMWRNKTDYGVCYHRPDMGRNILDVSVQKIKQKWMGKVGKRQFDYDLRSGRFKGTQETEYCLPTEIASPF